MLKIDLSDFIRSLSEAVDLTYVGLGVDWGSISHSSKVCYIACMIAERMNLDRNISNNIYYASLLHDVGLILSKELREVMHFESHDEFIHSKRGYEILKKCSYTEKFAEIVLHHHDKWAGPNESGVIGDAIPLGSRIIFVADRIDVLIRPREYILHQKDEIVSKINKHAGTYFDPRVVDAFNLVARSEAFWFDLTAKQTEELLQQYKFKENIKLDYDELEQIAEIFAQIVDSKSPFTIAHSRRVARVAYTIAKKLIFSPLECEVIKVAGLLHDLGKLAIPDELLDKPGALDSNEYELMKRHTYYTNLVLHKVSGMETIAQWAALHHEKLNGTGYPFHTVSEAIPLGSRILAVSDIFSALAEDRPYRKGYTRESIQKILADNASDGALDAHVVNLVINNIDELYNMLELN